LWVDVLGGVGMVVDVAGEVNQTGHLSREIIVDEGDCIVASGAVEVAAI